MGLLTGSSDRAEEVIQFFDKITDNLKTRVSTIPEFQVKNAYIGGYSEGSPDGILSTSPGYIPFRLVNVDNSLRDSQKSDMILKNQTIIPRVIKGLNPAGIFIDLSTIDNKVSAINEIEKIPEFVELKAVKDGSVYGLFPDSVYGKSHEIDIINAYMVGKAVYPDKFIDVDPKTISEYVFTFLYGEPIFDEINKEAGNLALTRIPVFT
jgi:iron complex transport system substrate-binding protein